MNCYGRQQAILSSRVPATGKLILLAIAFHMSREGQGFVSQEKLSGDTSLTTRTIRTWVGKLESRGVLVGAGSRDEPWVIDIHALGSIGEEEGDEGAEEEVEEAQPEILSTGSSFQKTGSYFPEFGNSFLARNRGSIRSLSENNILASTALKKIPELLWELLLRSLGKQGGRYSLNKKRTSALTRAFNESGNSKDERILGFLQTICWLYSCDDFTPKMLRDRGSPDTILRPSNFYRYLSEAQEWCDQSAAPQEADSVVTPGDELRDLVGRLGRHALRPLNIEAIREADFRDGPPPPPPVYGRPASDFGPNARRHRAALQLLSGQQGPLGASAGWVMVAVASEDDWRGNYGKKSLRDEYNRLYAQATGS